MVGGFLEGLACGGRHQGLPLVKMPGRLVEAHPGVGFLLHQQEATVPFHHGGHRDIGFPDIHRLHRDRYGKVSILPRTDERTAGRRNALESKA